MIHALKLLGLLTHTSGLQEFMTHLRKTQRHASSGLLRIGACFPDRARVTDLLRKEDVDDRLSLRVLVQIPGAALLPLRAGDPLVLAINLELFQIQIDCQLGSTWTGPITSIPWFSLLCRDPLGTDRASIDERHVREVAL
jgi:hypothetical protein